MSENGEAKLDSEKGKIVVDELMAKMTPEQQAQFKEALNKNEQLHIHLDQEGNVLLGVEADKAAEAATCKCGGEGECKCPGKIADPAQEIKDDLVQIPTPEQRKISNIQHKRQQQFQERLRRTMNQHKCDEQKAFQIMQQEDYDRMSPDQKVRRLESLVGQSMQRLAEDINRLEHNHYAIADAFDINYRAVSKMLIKLGIPLEEHARFMKESQDEALAEHKAKVEQQRLIQEAAAKKQQEAQEKIRMEAELGKNKPVEAKGAELPKDATVFGG